MLEFDAGLGLLPEQLAGVRMQDEMRDAICADVRRQHHAVCPGLQQLSLGGGHLAAGDDLDARVHVSRTERDEDIRGIIWQHGGQHAGTADAGGLEDRFIGGLALQREVARVPHLRHAVRRLIHDDKGNAARLELRGDHAADATKTADDGMLGEFLDFVFHAFASEGALYLGFRQPLHERASDKNDAGAAKQDQRDGPRPQPWVRDGNHLAKTDAEGRDDHHVERIAPRPARQPIAHREHDEHHAHEQHGVVKIRLRSAAGDGHSGWVEPLHERKACQKPCGDRAR